MAFVVEYKFVREDTSVDFPSTNEKDKEVIAGMKEAYNVVFDSTLSDDGLTRIITHSADNQYDYVSFYDESRPHFEKSKFSEKCAKDNIHFTMNIVENK